MSDLYEPYDELIRLIVLGKTLDVPANNLLLRQLQFVAPDIGAGRYCWNGECRYCEVQYRVGADGPEYSALACRIKGVRAMRLTRLALEVKYNLAEALAAAAPAED
jgi:hypothetical protein